MKHHGGNRRGQGQRAGSDEHARGRTGNTRSRTEHTHPRTEHTHPRTENTHPRTENTRGRAEHPRERTDHPRGRTEPVRERTEHARERPERERERGAQGRESPGERVARAFAGGSERERAPRIFKGTAREQGQWQSVADDGAHVFGVQPVLEALRAGARPVERVTVAEGAHETRLREILEIARYADIPIRRVPRTELQRLALGANHQGVVATIAAAHYTPSDELLDALAARVGTNEPPLAVVLDGVEDPRNLGAIIRTVECAGAHGVFVPERRAAGLTETVAKAAAGALEYVPVARVANVVRLVEELKGRGVWTIGTTSGAATSYADWDWTQPCALLLGGEGEGLRRLVRERCDVLVGIPLLGRIESLNVSVAAGIVLYEALRQRTVRRSASYNESRDMLKSDE
jgi:23S rRNA (guanosine2251-2'-O)-methyltransferase